MTTNNQPNLTATKTLFLSSQVRLLSSPLHLPPPSSLPTLPDKLLADILTRTNDRIRTHNRAVFPAQAQRHVAEQIETLFWNEVVAERELVGGGAGGRQEDTVVKREVDLCAGDNVLKELPEGWGDVVVGDGERDPDGNDHDAEDEGLEADTTSVEKGEDEREAARNYEEMRRQLLDLCRRRDVAAQKVQRYKQLQRLLEPYENAQERIQPNLVTKDGELMREMERMRVLLARVTARMGSDQGARADQVGGLDHERHPAPSFDERLAVAMGSD